MINQLFSNPFDQNIRIGLTGLSRAGKTVFLTSLIHNLLHLKRLPLFSPLKNGIIETVILQHQPNDALPRFAYEQHLDSLLSSNPQWPENTTTMSQIRLSIKYRPQNFLLRQIRQSKILTLDIIDYPGEWLLDLPLLELSFFEWGQRSFQLAKSTMRHPYAKQWLDAVLQIDANQPADERKLTKLAQLYTQFLRDVRQSGKGHFDLPPGRFLLPGDLENAPVLTFCPLPIENKPYAKNTYGHIMQRRFESYKKLVVKPFFEKYFARMDQQIILIDPLSALNQGTEALNDLSQSMEAILHILKPKPHSWLYRLLLGRPLSHVLLAATKADHVHHSQHDHLLALSQSLIDQAYRHIHFGSSKMKIMALAALRSTDELKHKDGRGLITGRLEGKDDIAVYPGEVPTSIRQALNHEYGFQHFSPPIIENEQEGFRHIRLDQALDFLLKDIIQ